MMEIAQKPYIKQYKYPLISDASFFHKLLYFLSLLLPFFIVYSTRNFYLSYTDTVTPHSLLISYHYNYHIQILTQQQQLFVYTNIYEQSNRVRTLTIDYTYQEKSKQHIFHIQWPKYYEDRIKKVNILFSFGYDGGNTTGQSIGYVYTEVYGVNLCDVSVVGEIGVKQGNNPSNTPPITQSLSRYQYDIVQTSLALQNEYSRYLYSSSDYLATNMQNTLLDITYKLKTIDYYVSSDANANILGQLIWSFAQYFPIAIVFFMVSRAILKIVFKQSIMTTVVVHEKRKKF